MCDKTATIFPARLPDSGQEKPTERQAGKGELKDTLPLHILLIQWTANPRVEEVISKLDSLPNCNNTGSAVLGLPKRRTGTDSLPGPQTEVKTGTVSRPTGKDQ